MNTEDQNTETEAQERSNAPDAPARETRTSAGAEGLTVRAESYDESANTVEIVYSTGADVDRGLFVERLVVSEEAIDAERLDAGAVHLILDHVPITERVIGRVIEHRIEGGAAVAVVKLSSSDNARSIIQQIIDSTYRSVSVGYHINTYNDEETDGRRLRTVTNWTPWEISMTPIPADPRSHVRSDARTLVRATSENNGNRSAVTEETETQVAEEAQTEVEEIDAMTPEEARAAERTRIGEIHQIQTRHGLPADFTQRHVDSGAEIEAVRADALEQIANRAAPAVDTARVTVTRDERETLVERATGAVVSRMTGAEPTEEAREFRNMSAVELAREFVGPSSRGMSRSEVIDRALSTRSGMHTVADFSHVLGTAGARTLRAAYEAAPRTFTPFVRETEVPDFRPVERVSLGDAPTLKKRAEGAEVTFGTIGESSETFQIFTYDRAVALSRQALVNDDLGAFARAAEMFGRRAAEMEADLVYAILTGNPMMSDGKALFHTAGHKNIGTAGAIDVASIAEGRALMRKQTGIDGAKLNLSPVALIVGPDDELAAEKLVAPIAAMTSGDVNPFAGGRLQVISDARIGSGWFLSAAPAQIDTIELAYLAGARGVQTKVVDNWERDGVTVGARLDVGAAAIDWRGLVKNAGA